MRLVQGIFHIQGGTSAIYLFLVLCLIVFYETEGATPRNDCFGCTYRTSVGHNTSPAQAAQLLGSQIQRDPSAAHLIEFVADMIYGQIRSTPFREAGETPKMSSVIFQK